MSYPPSDSPAAGPQGGPQEAAPDHAAPHQAASDQRAISATETFTESRDLLFSIVYNMLGSVAGAEDVLQETWLSWMARNRVPGAQPIHGPRSYLLRIAVNRALDQHAAGAVVPAESVPMSPLVVLETLSPLERGVFVLHEVFGYTHTEIAGILGRSTSAVRRLAHRAREHVHARRPRYEPDPGIRQQVTERFLAAARNGDVDDLLQILAPEVTLWGDGGGKARPAGGMRTFHGRDKVARVLVAGARRFARDLDVAYRSVNGDPSALMSDGDTTRAVIVLDLTPDSDQVCGIYIVADPGKLSHVE
jgi:DNA-directed RNA polymerase specialized sigma24 family protein